ncbi:uncharacterized protein LOC131594157 [Vicia villosa]|uniref:uncharacterized protein LOC131594157 n=1 Tax=Vicia villosa TaxID=3911 RepID=UPI00273B39DE|nr:uncharacterized protein LOC131594157 [Vicia villosa]
MEAVAEKVEVIVCSSEKKQGSNEEEWSTMLKVGRCRSVPRSSTMIIAWNLRGLNKMGKIKEISSRFVGLNPDIVVLIETRVKDNKAGAVRNKLNLRGEYVDNYQRHENGRIWVFWNDNKVGLTVVKVTQQMIHCSIHDTMGRWRYWLTAIYVMNQLEHRQKLWKDIEDIQCNQQGPWCIIGDFNNVVTSNDKIGGRQVQEHEYKDLCSMMERTGLYEMDSTGDHFTWTNKQRDNAIYSRIDRILGNIDWHQQHMDFTLHIMSPSVFDHAMLCLKENQLSRIQRKHFKFRNCLVEMEGYSNTVARSWNEHLPGRHMYVVWKKLQRLQPHLRALGKPLRDVQRNIVLVRNLL